MSLKISKEMGIFYVELAGKLLFLLSDSLVFLIIVCEKFWGGIRRINTHFISKVTFQIMVNTDECNMKIAAIKDVCVCIYIDIYMGRCE